jgi:CarboxypepD_reg-like domain
MKLRFTLPAALLLPVFMAVAQQPRQTQNIRGTITDADSKRPIAAATIRLQGVNIAAISDSLGHFYLPEVALGRQTLVVSRVGYEERQVADIMVTSGKEVELNVALTEKISQLEQVEIKGRRRSGRALNEFATASARSFSVEDTKRYPVAVFDPARMAMNFPGVSANGDFGNEIVVRGNSPKGMLWRLEGIEIPSPNHFTSLGNSGGAISMLSSSTLGTSDFFTGAFPAEYGNASSGVFDLNLRNGNTRKREYAFMIGALGIEAAAEGYFKKGSQSSYLFNYRYSTLALLNKIMDFSGSYLPEYQDLSFKINLPTKKAGTFSLFGLGGSNLSKNDPIADSSKWDEDDGNFFSVEKGKTGVGGISHQYFFNSRSYLKTTLAATFNSMSIDADTLNIEQEYKAESILVQRTEDMAYRASILYNNKLNARNTFRTGLIASHMRFDYNETHYDEAAGQYVTGLNLKGNNNYLQAYAQWKWRAANNLTINGGLHGTYFDLNDSWSIEPRASVQYRPDNVQTVTLSAGLHSKPEHLSTYYFQPEGYNGGELPNKGLELPKAFHTVLGYERLLGKGIQLKVETYYQHLYDIGVEAKENSEFSLINQASFWDLFGKQALVSSGKGTNAGIDVSLEKPFRHGLYYLLTGSLFTGKYTNYNGNEFNTRFNRGYQANLVAGKEWKAGSSGNRIWGINGKILASGGLRNSPIDLEASKDAGERVPVLNRYFTESGPMYFRTDVSFSYRINSRHITHTIMLDIQNVTNRENLYGEYYDNDTQTIKKAYQMGLIPVFNYRIEF